MGFNNLSEKDIVQNLQDAGYDSETIEKFMKANGNQKDMLRILQQQRIRILNMLHPVQKELECLDYLIYKIRKAV